MYNDDFTQRILWGTSMLHQGWYQGKGGVKHYLRVSLQGGYLMHLNAELTITGASYRMRPRRHIKHLLIGSHDEGITYVVPDWW